MFYWNLDYICSFFLLPFMFHNTDSWNNTFHIFTSFYVFLMYFDTLNLEMPSIYIYHKRFSRKVKIKIQFSRIKNLAELKVFIETTLKNKLYFTFCQLVTFVIVPTNSKIHDNVLLLLKGPFRIFWLVNCLKFYHTYHSATSNICYPYSKRHFLSASRVIFNTTESAKCTQQAEHSLSKRT